MGSKRCESSSETRTRRLPPLKAVRLRRRRPEGREDEEEVAFDEASTFCSTSSAVSVAPFTLSVETSSSCPGPGRARSLAQKGASAHFCFGGIVSEI